MRAETLKLKLVACWNSIDHVTIFRTNFFGIFPDFYQYRVRPLTVNLYIFRILNHYVHTCTVCTEFSILSRSILNYFLDFHIPLAATQKSLMKHIFNLN